MRNILLAAVLLTGCSVFAQQGKLNIGYVDTSFTWRVNSYESFNEYCINQCETYLKYNNIDSAIQIHGDTVALIRMLLHKIHEADSVQTQYWKFMDAACSYSNCVPSYYKQKENNCAWPKFWGFLYRNGYRSHKLKEPKTLPCCK